MWSPCCKIIVCMYQIEKDFILLYPPVGMFISWNYKSVNSNLITIIVY